MNDTVIVKGIQLALNGHICRCPGAWIVDVQFFIERLQPIESSLLIFNGSFFRNSTFNDGISSSGKVISPVVASTYSSEDFVSIYDDIGDVEVGSYRKFPTVMVSDSGP